MQIRRIHILMLVISLLYPVTGILFYPFMPETMATHWNIHGQVDGYMQKVWGTFACLIIPLAVAIFLFAIAAVQKDKRKRTFIEVVSITAVLCMYASYLAMLLFNAGILVNFKLFMWSLLFLTLVALGIEYIYFKAWKFRKSTDRT